MRNRLSCVVLGCLVAIAPASKSLGQALPPEQLDLPPEILENSPVLQRWTEFGVPDVLQTIRDDPSFPTRFRLGYAQFPSNDQRGGISVGVEDIFFQKTLPLTLSAEGHTTFDGDHAQIAARLNYYLFPLGNQVNIAPTVGYQAFSGTDYEDGLEVGLKVQLSLSRSGASTISLSQQFVNVGTAEEVGVTTLNAAYALSHQWRAATEIQKHHSSAAKERKVAFFLEWMP